MEHNIFTEILISWNKLSKKQKIELAQNAEKIIADWQKRKAREICLDGKLQEKEHAIGLFKSEEPQCIFLDYFSKSSPLLLIETLYHEGTHAMLYDYKTEKNSPVFFGKFDAETFFCEERFVVDFFCKHGRKKWGDIVVSSYNEQVAYREGQYFALFTLFEICQTPEDCKMFLDDYLTIIMEAEDVEKDKREFAKQKDSYANSLKEHLRQHGKQLSDRELNIIKTIKIDQEMLPGMADCLTVALKLAQSPEVIKDKNFMLTYLSAVVAERSYLPDQYK